MESKSRLIKNTMIIAMGKFSTQVISFLLLPLYTTILTDTEYGIYDFINSLVLFLIPFCTLLMEESMFRFLIDADTEEKKKDIISQSIIFILGNMILLTTLLYVVLSYNKYEFKNYILIYLIVSIYNSLAQSLARGLGDIKLYSIGSFISSTLTLILNVIFIAHFRIGIKGLLLAFIIANIASPTFIAIKLNMFKYISIRKINLKRMKDMILYSIPLVPNSISWVIINLSSRLIITPVLGPSANGIYAIANKFPSIINTLYGYFYTAWQEEASRAIKEEGYKKYYNIIYKDLKRLLFAVCICLMASLPFIFNLLVNDKFYEAYRYIPLLVLSMFLSNISGFYGGIFSANKNTKVMGTSTVISAIINLIVNLALIRYLGLYSAALAAVISNFIVCKYRKFKLKRYISFDRDETFYGYSLSISIFILVCYYSKSYTLYFSGLIIAMIYSIYINKNILLSIYFKLRRKIWVN